MKVFLRLLFAVLILFGGLFYAHQQGLLPSEISTPLETIIADMKTMLPEFTDELKEDIKEEINEVLEGNNDATDKTEENKPSDAFSLDLEEEETIQAFINSDTTNNVDLVLIAPNGEGLTALRSPEGRLKSIVLVSADGKTGEITLDEELRVQTFSFAEATLTYSNYRSSMVDIQVDYADGSSEELLNQQYTNTTLSQTSGLIPQAFAGWYEDLACSGEDCLHNTLPDIGTALGTISCGVGIGSILFSGGATAPLTYLGCAGLATRITTNETTIGPCEGDILNCARDKVIDFFEEYGPKSLRDGVTLMGTLQNINTGTDIEVAVLSGEQQRNNKQLRGEAKNGKYSIDLPGFGISSITFSAEGFQDEILIVGMTNASLSIKTVRTQNQERFELPYEAYVDKAFAVSMLPDGWVRGEVIDTVEGEALADVRLTLSDGYSTIDQITTDKDGTFNLKPSIFEQPHTFTLTAEHEDYSPQTIALPITYEVQQNSDEYDIPEWNGVVKMGEKADKDSYSELPSGAQTFPIRFNFSEGGLTHTGNGTLTLNLDASNTHCRLSMEGSSSGVPEIPAKYSSEIPSGIEIPSVSGTFSATSQSCTGFTSGTGTFTLNGQLNGKISFTILGTAFEDEDQYPFLVSGTPLNDSVQGSILIDNTATIPFQ